MKKFFSMMVAVAAMFAFAACGNEETPEPQKPAGKTQLEKPVVTVSNVTEDGFTLTWEPVANATKYLVFVNADNKPETTETTYTFSGLDAGTYKPHVKAVGEGNYKDSDYSDDVEPIVLTGATSVNWFTQTVALPEDSAELAAKGVNSSNTFTFNWKGDGVESLSYMYFFAEDLAGMSDDDILAEMYGLDAETLAEVNNAEGVDLQFGDLAGGTTYVLCAYVTQAGKGFMAKSEITTNPTVLTLGTQAWLGNWNASTSRILEWNEEGLFFSDQTTEFTLTVEPYNEWYSNYVWVDGLSALGEGVPAFGVISHEKVVNADKTAYEYTGNYVLDIMCYETIGELGEGSGVYAVWLPYCSKNDGKYTFVSGSFAGYTLTLNPTTGAVTCKVYEGYLNETTTFKVEMLDVFALNTATSQLSPLAIDEQGTPCTIYKAGNIENVTKVAAAASTSSVAPKAMKAASFPTSVVVAM